MCFVKTIHFTNRPETGKRIKIIDASLVFDQTFGRNTKMITSVHTATLAYRGVQSVNPVAHFALRTVQAFAAWRQRRHLARLDDAALADVGLSRRAAMIEAARPVWDVPASWRR
jgi:uncharacterized protein YjiS (DUF1127 family)